MKFAHLMSLIIVPNGHNPVRTCFAAGLFVLSFLGFEPAHCQSVGYYPWNGLLTISTNPNRVVWGDVRLQTNTLFGSLSTELLPMINLKQTELTQVYAGGGVRFNFIGRIAGQTKNLVEGYSLNVGVRVKPFKENRNVQIAFELAPFVERKFDSGVLKSNFGVVYVLK